MCYSKRFESIDGYTFEEGVAVLVFCKVPNGVIQHITSTHNRSHLHSEIHKSIRQPYLRRAVDAHFKENFNAKPVSQNETPKAVAVKTVTEKAKDLHEDGEDQTDIVITLRDVHTHTNTRYEDMPNAITQELWLKRQDKYRELQQAHLKMRTVPEGEEHNEERAKHRADVIRLNGEVEDLWKLIDAEIERFNAEKERADKRADNTPNFNVSTYRSYISKALRKKELSDAQKVELQHRVDEMIACKLEISNEQIEKLKAVGIKVG